MGGLKRIWMNNYVVAAFPALYTWQIYGFWRGAGMFAFAIVLLAGISWLFILRGFSLEKVWIPKVILIVALMVIVGISAAEICSNGEDCKPLF